MNPASLGFTDDISYIFDEIHIFSEVFFSLRVFDRAVLQAELTVLAALTRLCFCVEVIIPLSSIPKLVPDHLKCREAFAQRYKIHSM